LTAHADPDRRSQAVAGHEGRAMHDYDVFSVESKA
jgi:hypothetical protein